MVKNILDLVTAFTIFLMKQITAKKTTIRGDIQDAQGTKAQLQKVRG